METNKKCKECGEEFQNEIDDECPKCGSRTEMQEEYKAYLKRMLNGSAPIEHTMSFKEYKETA